MGERKHLLWLDAHVQYCIGLALEAIDDPGGAKAGFSTSLPQFVFAEVDMQTRMRTQYTYFIGLAHLGLDQKEAGEAFKTVLGLDPNHFGALDELRRIIELSEPNTSSSMDRG